MILRSVNIFSFELKSSSLRNGLKKVITYIFYIQDIFKLKQHVVYIIQIYIYIYIYISISYHTYNMIMIMNYNDTIEITSCRSQTEKKCLFAFGRDKWPSTTFTTCLDSKFWTDIQHIDTTRYIIQSTTMCNFRSFVGIFSFYAVYYE